VLESMAWVGGEVAAWKQQRSLRQWRGGGEVQPFYDPIAAALGCVRWCSSSDGGAIKTSWGQLAEIFLSVWWVVSRALRAASCELRVVLGGGRGQQRQWWGRCRSAYGEQGRRMGICSRKMEAGKTNTMPVRFENSTEELRTLQPSRELEVVGGAVCGRGVWINTRKIGKETRQFSVDDGELRFRPRRPSWAV
jgi:hypothetical protein